MSRSRIDDEENGQKDLRTNVVTDVYLRNIQDRFPSIPLYLARRLAEANARRVLRLIRARQARDYSRQPEDLADNALGIYESTSSHLADDGLDIDGSVNSVGRKRSLYRFDETGTSLDSSIFREPFFSKESEAAVFGCARSGSDFLRASTFRPSPSNDNLKLGQDIHDEHENGLYLFSSQGRLLHLQRSNFELTQGFWSRKRPESSARSGAPWPSMNGRLKLNSSNLRIQVGESMPDSE